MDSFLETSCKENYIQSSMHVYIKRIMIINDLIDTEGNLMDWMSANLNFELAGSGHDEMVKHCTS